jgi:methionyl-tRNA formyltransferase
VKFALAGTPDFAAWVLSDLDNLGRRPVLVVSQPDRPQGRGRRPTPPPAMVEAARLGLECLQTEDINSPDVLRYLRAAGVDTLLVTAFGQILKEPLLESLLCLNIHASLLPAYRGAAPIERALAAGESRTGVSIMRITEGLDEGPWALQTSVSIGLRDDAGSIGRISALLGAVGTDQVMRGLADGTITWTQQEAGRGSYATKLGVDDCLLDTTRGARAAHDQVRSLSPAVGAHAVCGGLRVKIWRTWPYGQPGLKPVPKPGAAALDASGRVVAKDGRLFVGCAEGAVEILTIQPAGKSRMEAAAFLRGYQSRLGDSFGPDPKCHRAACGDQ